jgi:hypothetical protein
MEDKVGSRLEYTHWKAYALMIAGGTLTVMLPVLMNGFPFVFFKDTIDYVILTPRLYRSPFYQLFIFLVGMKQFIWAPVVAQALFCSTVILILLRNSAMATVPRFALMIIVLTCCSSMAIFAGFLMPDIFTGLMFLCQFLLIFRWRSLTVLERSVVSALMLLSTAVHLSHLTMAVAMLLGCVVIRWIWKKAPLAMPGMLMTSAIMFCVLAASVTYDRFVFGTWSPTPAGSSFLLANLIAYGPAREELRANCPNAGYKLCAHLDELPDNANQFLWYDGPFAEVGGFAGMREESGQIVGSTLRHRGKEVALISIRNSLRAMTMIRPAMDIVPFRASRDLDLVLTHYNAGTLASFERGRQQQGQFPGTQFDIATVAGFLLALMVIAGIAWRVVRAGRIDILIFPGFAIVAFLGNAVTCATLSGVFDRYQSRVSWLVVASALLAFMEWQRLRGQVSMARDVAQDFQQVMTASHIPCEPSPSVDAGVVAPRSAVSCPATTSWSNLVALFDDDVMAHQARCLPRHCGFRVVKRHYFAPQQLTKLKRVE